MEICSTKQRILIEALTLFSVKGYKSVTVAEIADAVGIQPPSLYKHYKNKKEIFKSIITELDAKYEQQANLLQIDDWETEKDREFYVRTSEDMLVELGKKLFLYFLHDEYICKFRKLLTIGRYDNREIANLYEKRYIDTLLSYQGTVFERLKKAGVLIPEDPKIMALHYYSPISLLLSICDCHPERESEALHMVEQHIRQFVRLYRNTEYKREDT